MKIDPSLWTSEVPRRVPPRRIFDLPRRGRRLLGAVVAIGLAIAVPCHAAFTPHPSGIGIVDDFDESEPDTDTWVPNGFVTVTHEDGKVKMSATIGFNQVYTQRITAPTDMKINIGDMVSVEWARIDTNTLAGDRVVIGPFLTDHDDSRSFSDRNDHIGVYWTQNDSSVGAGAEERGPKPEHIGLDVRDNVLNYLAGHQPPTIQPEPVKEPNLFEPKFPESFVPRLTPGNDGPDPGGFDPIKIGFPGEGGTPHFYRFEVWRLSKVTAKARILDVTGDIGLVIYDETVDWTNSGPDPEDPTLGLPDDMVFQFNLHHSRSLGDNLWILPHVVKIYEDVGLQSAAPSETDSDSGPSSVVPTDLDGDGDVDADDVDFWLSQYGTFYGNAGPTILASVRGDLDLDFDVDIIDFGIFAGNFGGAADILGGDLSLVAGDMPGKNGIVDIEDFGVFAGNFGFSNAAAPEAQLIPEPAMLTVVTLAGVLLMRRRRR